MLKSNDCKWKWDVKTENCFKIMKEVENQWSRRALRGIRDDERWFSLFESIMLPFDLGVDVGMKLLVLGVFALATQLKGVLLEAASLNEEATDFLGGVEYRSMLFSSSSKIRFFCLFCFLIVNFSSVIVLSSSVDIAVDKSFSANFFTSFSSFLFFTSSIEMIGVLVISVIGDLEFKSEIKSWAWFWKMILPWICYQFINRLSFWKILVQV